MGKTPVSETTDAEIASEAESQIELTQPYTTGTWEKAAEIILWIVVQGIQLKEKK
jgi:hypothetical protein